jgi:hypothetical protein
VIKCGSGWWLLVANGSKKFDKLLLQPPDHCELDFTTVASDAFLLSHRY